MQWHIKIEAKEKSFTALPFMAIHGCQDLIPGASLKDELSPG